MDSHNENSMDYIKEPAETDNIAVEFGSPFQQIGGESISNII